MSNAKKDTMDLENVALLHRPLLL
ncbi:hypothetical protein LINPERPRIM_LOCUS26184 [Linum perenne]